MDIGLPLRVREHTNLRTFQKLQKRICREIEGLEKQKNGAAAKKFDEPKEILDQFENLDGKLMIGNVELLDLKHNFEEIAELVQYSLQSNRLRIIPVGSFVTGCTRRNKLAIDAYLELDTSLGSATCADVVIMYNNKKMHPQCPSLKFFNYNVFEEKDP